MKSHLIRLTNITKSFDKKQIIKDFNLEIYPDEFLSLSGKNGCGKTTLIRIIAGLEKEFLGRVDYDGIRKEEISFIFQNRNLLPWYTVRKNLKVRLVNSNLLKDEKEELINFQLEEMGISSYANYYPCELSGGTIQKVSLAVALITKPKLLILDEPFSAIDVDSRIDYYKLLAELKKKYNLAMVIVTHDSLESKELSFERFIEMQKV